MTYKTCCVHSTADAIGAMVDQATKITYRTFRKHAEDIDKWADDAGYRVPGGRMIGYGGLTLGEDYHVRYYKSKYKGVLCYFMVHSAIEYIWTN